MESTSQLGLKFSLLRPSSAFPSPHCPARAPVWPSRALRGPSQAFFGPVRALLGRPRPRAPNIEAQC
eukprot:4010974-Alexandrium_andersonii.AAC.1